MKRAAAPRSPNQRSVESHLLLGWFLLFLMMPLAGTRTFGRELTVATDEPVKSWPVESKRWALVIGVSDYGEDGLTPLKSAASGAHLLADALKQYAGFPQENIYLMTPDQPKEWQPRHNNLLARMSDIKRQVPADGLLLIAFSGHSIEVGDRVFLMLSDAQKRKDLSFMEQTALSLTFIEQWIKEVGVKQALLLLDTCRNDPTRDRAVNRNDMTETYRRALNLDVRTSSIAAFARFYATSVGQSAYEANDQSFFMQAVVEALRGSAANNQGEVTLGGLIKYVGEEVPKRVLKQKGQEAVQQPDILIRGYYSEEVVIAVSSASRKAATQASAKTSIDEQVLDYKFWEAIQSKNDAAVFEEYLRKFPNGLYAGLAKIKLKSLKEAAPANVKSGDAGDPTGDAVETTYWNSIANSDNKEAFNAYLAQYPNGRFVEAARKRMAEIEEVAYWNRIAQTTSPEPFNEYLKRYPSGKFATQAKARLEEHNELAAWQAIENSADPQAFKGYLERYPNGKFARQASSKIDELLEKMYWQSISTSNNVEALNEYLKQYPNGKYAAAAKSLFDELTEAAYWNAVSNSTIADAVNEYLKRYPNGRFADQARTRLTKLAELPYWTSITNSRDAEAFKEYLRRYPNGAFVKLATLRIEELSKTRAGAAPPATPPTATPAVKKTERPERTEGAVNRIEPPGSSVTNSAAKPTPTAPPSGLESLLRPFEFDTRTLGSQGQPGNRHHRQARFFNENIGNEAAIQLVEIEGGEFLQGTSEKESSQVLDDSKRYVAKEGHAVIVEMIKAQMPQHRVTVQSFYMGMLEVTQAQWRAVAHLPKVNRSLSAAPSIFKGDSLPVENISWEDAVEFCERLSRATGRKYRLPTEAEWEYACRAGSSKEFYLGETITPEWANYDGRSAYGSGPRGFYRPGTQMGRGSSDSEIERSVTGALSRVENPNRGLDPNEKYYFRGQTIIVGSLGTANAFGLYDMHGNVWEWCQDNWHDNYEGAPVDGSTWVDGDPSYKVLRGGSWQSLAAYCRSASRLKAGSAGRRSDIGFRVVLVDR